MYVKLKRVPIAIYTVAALVLIAIALLAVLFDVKISSFTSDVTAIAGLHPLSGMLSNLGIYFWCISATTSFFSAALLYATNQREHLSFLFSSALLSAYLMLDDAFLFHEDIAERIFGLNEKAVFVVLGLAVLAYLFRFNRVILQTNYLHLLAAFVFLSSSVTVDSILEPWVENLGDWEFLIEDGAKWLGIVSWCVYHTQTAFSFVLNGFNKQREQLN